jgi:hypothetical protein
VPLSCFPMDILPKKKWLLPLILVAGAIFFAKPTFESSLGFIAKRVCKAKLGAKLSYKNVKWHMGKVIFQDPFLRSKESSASAERVVFTFDWKELPHLRGHLDIERPDIVFTKLINWSSEGETEIPDVTIVARNGTVDFGIAGAQANFTFEKMKPGQLGHLILNWENSSLDADLSRANGVWKLIANLDHFEAAFLNDFHAYPPAHKGTISGPISIFFKEEKIDRASLNLQIHKLDYGPFRGVDGDLSFNSDLGAKWEFSGRGENLPVSGWGMASFANHWLESELYLGEGSCQIGKEGCVWRGSWGEISSPQLSFFREIALLIAPDLSRFSGECEGFSGEGTFTTGVQGVESWECHFFAGSFGILDGTFKGVVIPGGKLTGFLSDWAAEIGSSQICGQGTVGPQFDFSYELGGVWDSSLGKIPFSFPLLKKEQGNWAFDARFKGKTWDFLRLAGTSDGEGVFLDEKSHLFGTPFSKSLFEKENFDVEITLDWASLLAAETLLVQWGLPSFGHLPCKGKLDLRASIDQGQTQLSLNGVDFTWEERSCPLSLLISKEEWGWNVRSLKLGSFLSHFELREERIEKGAFFWKGGNFGEFQGRWESVPYLRCELAIPSVTFDLSELVSEKAAGLLKGQGHFIYDKEIEADFDLVASSLEIAKFGVESKKPLHFHFSSATGSLLHGVELDGPLNFKVELVKHEGGELKLEDIQASIPSELFSPHLDQQEAVQLSGTFTFSEDFSKGKCYVKEGVIPIGGVRHPIQDLTLQWNEGSYESHFTYFHLGNLIPVELNGSHIHEPSGSVSLGGGESPLRIDWQYTDTWGLNLRSIQGSFAGVKASFFPDMMDALVGKAEVDFNVLSTYLPKEIAEGFQEIKLGEGYELKGKFKLEENLPYFKGILVGKDCELFGYQFQTLFSEIDIQPNQVRISDLKSSDKGGSFLAPEILVASKGEGPWTISIPELTILDLRPSLLRKKGDALGAITPLVIRELIMKNFHGILDDGTTYTAEGDLSFINTFKRERTFMDLPVDFFSRIFGLDLELLIPVCGNVKFDLKNGYFRLNELKDAFSENQRSEFFFEGTPTMDLNGNLDILIKMKQYVLFKFTQPFLISIDGKLDDPQFHLRGKT